MVIYILIKISKLPLCKMDNFMKCEQKFLIFYTTVFMLLTNTLYAKR